MRPGRFEPRRKRRRSAMLALARGAALSAILGVATLCSLSCGQNSSASPAALATQIQGWWMTPNAGGCFCPQQPECAGHDCAGYAVLGLLAGGRYFDGYIAYSKNASTMSSWGEPPSATFTVDDSNSSVTVTQTVTGQPPSVMTVPVSVSSGQMTFGTRVVTRVPTNLATALDSATANGGNTWKSFPVPAQ
jgi:hypothetical protein